MSILSCRRYPPKNGRPYFASHFIMGGEKFDSPTPESFLFGENCDLNYLGSKPVSFPYPPPAANEPTKTLKSHINIRQAHLFGCITVVAVLVQGIWGRQENTTEPLGR